MGFFNASIGQKYLVAITGLLLTGFVFSHAMGNFLLFIGPHAYNMYSHALISNPFIYVIEGALFFMFLFHFATAMHLTAKNLKARPEKYAVVAAGQKATSQVTKMMAIQGFIILIFTILHLITFKYGTLYYAEYDGVQVRDLYKLVVEVFQSPVYTFGYVIIMIILGMHLSHGVQSAVKSLGFNHPRYECKIRVVGYLISAIISLGFLSQPLYVFFMLK